MSGQGIRAGRAYVEVTANSGPLERGLSQAQGRLDRFGKTGRAAMAPLRGIASLLTGPLGMVAAATAAGAAAYAAAGRVKTLIDRFTGLSAAVKEAGENIRDPFVKELERIGKAGLEPLVNTDALKEDIESLEKLEKERIKLVERLERASQNDPVANIRLGITGGGAKAGDRVQAIEREQKDIRDRIRRARQMAQAQEQSDIDARYRDAAADAHTDRRAEEDAERQRRQAMMDDLFDAEREGREQGENYRQALLEDTANRLKQLRREEMSDAERLRDIHNENLERVKELREIGTDAARRMADELERALSGDLARRLKELNVDPESAAQRVSTRGQFGGMNAAQALGSGTAMDRTAKATERMAKDTREIARNTRTGGVFG